MKLGDLVTTKEGIPIWKGRLAMNAESSHPPAAYPITKSGIYILKSIYESDTYFRDSASTVPVKMAVLIAPDGLLLECDLDLLEEIK